MTVKINTAAAARELLSRYDTFLFDCDGVIWIGDELLPSVKETLQLLQKEGKTSIFVSNNSTKARTDYVKKLASFGIENIELSHIINSAYSTAIYVNDVLKFDKSKKVWVLGQSGITKELENFGYTTQTFDDLKNTLDDSKLDMNHIADLVDSDVGCVVVGLDFDTTYLKVGITMQHLMKKDVPFIATNIDSTFPFKNTKLPGAGSIVDIVSYASGRQPDAICGKPEPGMMTSILSHNDIQKSRTIMVGDRLNTDMRFGSSNGIDTLLVLTGIEVESTVAGGHEDVTYYADKLGDLFLLSQ